MHTLIQNLILYAILFSINLPPVYMVAIAQLVRASDCGSEGRGFEPHWLPQSFSKKEKLFLCLLFIKTGTIFCYKAEIVDATHQNMLLKGC
jgi:hypothetical protein